MLLENVDNVCYMLVIVMLLANQLSALATRVARWFVFIPKLPIWVIFGGPWSGKCWHILCPFGIFSAIWYNLWPFGIVCGLFGIFFPFWYIGTKKNLAILLPTWKISFMAREGKDNE
jgi:hypothetical protein